MTHSYDGVDDEVAKMLPSFGYAAEVGANDGLLYSNTLLFENMGWVVMCVEPNPLLEQSGRGCRKLWRQVAAGANDGEAHFISCGGYPHASNSGIANAPSQGSRDGTSHTVTMLRLDRILEEAGFPRLDLLSVDVEGYEREVMKGFTIEKWNPKVIILEFWEDTDWLPDGYYKHSRRSFDNIYVRKPV